MSEKHLICVCICTYKRPKQLDRLLWEVRGQETGGLFEISVIVVDNDRSESARLVVEGHSRRSGMSISYHLEPRQNIALARNRAVERAAGDLIAFIDDDELPEPRWLLDLYKAIQSYGASGVLGPVLPRFDSTPPKWVLRGRFFERPAHVSGHVLEWKETRTGNVLLKSDCLKTETVWFRPEFGSGGEDRDFFRRMIKKGCVFVWSNDAPVYESVPPERWRIEVMIKRALLRGKMSLSTSEGRYHSLLVSLAAIPVYATSLPMLFVFGPILGYAVFMRTLIKSCDHLGKILTLLSINPIKEKYIG